jgi:hypothetical protein
MEVMVTVVVTVVVVAGSAGGGGYVELKEHLADGGVSTDVLGCC